MSDPKPKPFAAAERNDVRLARRHIVPCHDPQAATLCAAAINAAVDAERRDAAAKALRDAADCGANWCSDEVREALRSRADAIEKNALPKET